MIKILTILGSPRKKGNTATVLQEFEKLISDKVELEHINVVDLKINGCIGCENCQKELDKPGCIQKDDMQLILDKILNADLVVYAAPVYVWDFPAQMKAVIDRHTCLVKWKGEESVSLVAGKKAMLLTTCGGSAEENADLMFQIFKRQVKYLQCENLGAFAVPNCTVPKELGREKEKVPKDMVNALIKAKLMR